MKKTVVVFHFDIFFVWHWASKHLHFKGILTLEWEQVFLTKLRLNHEDPAIRYHALMAFVRLIVNDLVKVREQHCDIAMLIADSDEQVASVTKGYFKEKVSKVRVLDCFFLQLKDFFSRTHTTVRLIDWLIDVFVSCEFSWELLYFAAKLDEYCVADSCAGRSPRPHGSGSHASGAAIPDWAHWEKRHRYRQFGEGFFQAHWKATGNSYPLTLTLLSILNSLGFFSVFRVIFHSLWFFQACADMAYRWFLHDFGGAPCHREGARSDQGADLFAEEGDERRHHAGLPDEGVRGAEAETPRR